MKITLLERIMIEGILPTKGNIKTLTIAKDAKKKVALTQDDYTKYDIKILPDGRMLWNADGAKAEFDLEFTALETNEIKSTLQKLDKESELSADCLTLAEKFGIIGE